GSMGPTGEVLQPVGSCRPEAAREAFAEQARALARGGVDLLWIETVSSAEELEVAVEAATATGLPVVATMSFDTGGRTMMGITPERAFLLARGLPVPPAAFGANCGTGPAGLVAAILAMRRVAGADDILVAKANCGVPVFEGGAVRYSGTPEVMGHYARLARAAGARIIGGCCGTTGEHLRAMRAALDRPGPEPPPDPATIERLLGALPTPAVGRERARARRRRRVPG
ncbi:MAG TPA: methionine synthase, partial [Rhodospirillales bacterium]|nr:methionine synthase [Rhodospirillales bacterium]